MAPVVFLAAGVLGLNATSNILDPVDPPLAAGGPPRLPPGTPRILPLAKHSLDRMVHLGVLVVLG